MPTVLRITGYRFFFYAEEGAEPPHVHLEYGDKIAKFWLAPVRLASQRRFRPHQLARERDMVMAHERWFLEAWNEYHSRKI